MKVQILVNEREYAISSRFLTGLLSFTDRREGECFLDVVSLRGDHGICRDPLGDPVTRSTCCCSIGKAWGPRCEVCPPEDSDEYEQLCPGGRGFRPNTITVRCEKRLYGDKFLLLDMTKHVLQIHSL